MRRNFERVRSRHRTDDLLLHFGLFLTHEDFNFGHFFENFFGLHAFIEEQNVDDRDRKEEHCAHDKREHKRHRESEIFRTKVKHESESYSSLFAEMETFLTFAKLHSSRISTTTPLGASRSLTIITGRSGASAIIWRSTVCKVERFTCVSLMWMVP